MTVATRYADKAKCPGCGHEIDSASEIRGRDIEPKRGDLTLCVKCAEILIFEDPPNVSKITEGEWVDLSIDEQISIKRVVAKIKAIQSAN